MKKYKQPYLIAEAGVNHEGNIDIALKMVEEAARAGADAIKFQTYKAEKISSKNSPAYWDQTKEETNSQFELFKKYDSFGEQEYVRLANACKENNIDFLSTPFDFEAAVFLNPLMKYFKVSSSDLTNEPFLKHIATFKKPVLLSVGASKTSEIFSAVETLKESGVLDITLLHCVLSYPTKYEDANLQLIENLSVLFPNLNIGYSDHTIPDESMLVLTSAYLAGATVIEKHFTLDKTLPGNDHYHAMDPQDIRIFKKNIALIKTIFSDSFTRPLLCETEARKHARRSLVANIDIKRGEIFSDKNITFKRPGHGISPKLFEKIKGKKANMDIKADTIITWDLM